MVALPKAPDAGGGPALGLARRSAGGAHRGAGGPCLNSPLGMAGTLALLLLGQLLFGALCDGLGWLGLARRRPSGKDALAALLVLAGALLIVLHGRDTMTLLILMGLLNGVAVSLSRTLNGRLASAGAP